MITTIKCPHCNGTIELAITQHRPEPEAAINPNKPVNVMCPECGGEMISRSGKYGTFWGCAKYPNCKGTRDSMGRSREERQAESDKENQSRQQEGFSFRRIRE